MSVNLSAVDICNLALSRIGVLQQITSIDPPDATPAGLACAAVYTLCRKELMHDFPWPFASKYAELALLATDPNEEWTYAYAYPSDCLRIRRLTSSNDPTRTSPSWDREDTNPYPFPYEIGYIDGQTVIYTDLQAAWCKYTFDMEDTNPWTPEFANILAWRLAVDLAYPLANSEERRATAQKNYEREKLEGAAHAMNEAQISKPFMPGNVAMIRGRFYQ